MASQNMMAFNQGISLDYHAVILLLLCYTFSAYQFTKKGDVVPVDPYVFIGEVLELNCTILNTSLVGNSSYLYFVKMKVRISRNYTRIINSRTLQLKLPIRSPEDDGNYVCWSGYTRAATIVANQFVKVDYKPKKVDTIDCRVYNWDSMSCIWNLGVVYNYTEDIDVSLAWTIQAPQYDCPHLTPTSCSWWKNDGSDSFRTDSIYRMVVIVKNKKRNVQEKSPVFEISTTNIVQPQKIINFSYQMPNSTCLKLFWQHSRSERNMQYTVAYKSKWDGLHWTMVNIKKRSIVLCGLTPYTMYTFKISCKPTNSGFWSNESVQNIKTKADVPGKSPDISNVYFLDETKASQNCSNVMFYWKVLEQKLQYGLSLGYKIVYRSKSRHFSFQEIEISNANETTGTIRMCRDREYEIHLFSLNNIGISSNYSVLYVPAKKQRPGLPTNFITEIISEGNSKIWQNLSLNWKRPSFMPAGFQLKGYTLFWCKKVEKSNSFKCKDSPSWLQLSDVNAIDLKFRKNEVGSSLFGISADALSPSQKIYNSGLVWSECVFRQDFKPRVAPEMWFSDTVNNALSIHWKPLDCQESMSLITMYLIHYCPIDESDNCTGDTNIKYVKGTESSMVINGLIPGLRYQVSLQAASDAGKGPKSNPMYKVVSDNKHLTSGQIAGISIGSFIALLLILIGIITMIKKSLHFAKKCNEKLEVTYPKELPSLPDQPPYTEVDSKPYSIVSSASSYDSEDHCSETAPVSPTVETPLITESRNKRTRTSGRNFHSPKLSRTCQPVVVEKRSSATWSPRSSTIIDVIDSPECSQSTPVTLLKTKPLKQNKAICDLSQIPVKAKVQSAAVNNAENDGYSLINNPADDEGDSGHASVASDSSQSDSSFGYSQLGMTCTEFGNANKSRVHKKSSGKGLVTNCMVLQPVLQAKCQGNLHTPLWLQGKNMHASLPWNNVDKASGDSQLHSKKTFNKVLEDEHMSCVLPCEKEKDNGKANCTQNYQNTEQTNCDLVFISAQKNSSSNSKMDPLPVHLYISPDNMSKLSRSSPAQAKHIEKNISSSLKKLPLDNEKEEKTKRKTNKSLLGTKIQMGKKLSGAKICKKPTAECRSEDFATSSQNQKHVDSFKGDSIYFPVTDLPPHFFKDPEITSDLPTTDL